MSGSAALAAAGRCLGGGFSGCLLPTAGLGSLGLLLLVLLLVAGVTQTMGAASVAHAPPRPYHLPQHQYSPAQHGYQLVVFGPGGVRPPAAPTAVYTATPASHYYTAPPATQYYTAPPATQHYTAPPATHYTTSTRDYTTSTTTFHTSPPARSNDSYSAYRQTDGAFSYATTPPASTAARLPPLQLGYGVPVTDFLSAQASVSAATHQQLDTRPSYTAEENFTVPLIPDTIPLPGRDYPDDGCARDEVRRMWTHRSYSPWEPCQPLLEQGECPYNQWLVVNKYTKQGECVPRLCPDGFAFIATDGLCHDVREPALCPGSRRVFLTAFGEASCGCGDGQYLDTEGTCRPLFSTDVCPYSQQLRFNDLFRLQCAISLCPPDKPINFQGWCKAFGDPCGDYRFILALDTNLLEPRCFQAEELTGSGHVVHPTEKPREVAARPRTTRSPPSPKPTTPAPEPTTEALPHLQDSYLPPPGQFTQYARRQGLWSRGGGGGGGRGGGWGRSTLAQWLGLAPRGRPRRRRPPPQTPLLDPWSRLDIDQVTFVDSERINSDEFVPARRQRRRRVKRQIFSKVPLLNSCRPGARTGPNFKCRDKVLPESSGRTARSPIPPANAPSCGPGQRLDPLGRCSSSSAGSALGK